MPRKRKPPPRTRKRRPSPKLDRALTIIADAAVTGRAITIQDAATQAGMRRETLSRVLRRDDVTARALAQVRRRLGGAALVAAAGRLEGLIHAQSEYVSLDAAKHTLAIAGIKPKEQPLAAGGGLVVNLVLQHVKLPAEPIDITPQIGTQPAQIEQPKAQAHDNER